VNTREFTPGADDAAFILGRIAAFGMPPAEGGGEDRLTVPTEAWGPVVGMLNAQRLHGLAVAALEAGYLMLSPADAEREIVLNRDAAVWSLLLERMLLEVGRDLERAGVEHVVLKGPGLAHTVYPDPAWRSFTDLDLLVRTRDWTRACETLAEQQFHRELPEPRPGFDERFGKAAEMTGRGGTQVDLHRTLVIGPFGLWIDAEELFRSTTTFPLGGREFRMLDGAGLLVNACLHASLGWRPPLLGPVRDVAQVAWHGNVDWDAFADRTKRWRLGAVVKHAFATASEALGVALPEQVKAFVAAPANRSEQRALEAYTTTKRGRGGLALSTMRAIPGLRAKAAYARGLLVPDRKFLAARASGGAPSYFRRWSVAMHWARRR